MSVKENPFTPNFGQVPLHIAGRTKVISEIISAMKSGEGHPARSSILIGARGTGKTALLTYLADESKRRGWISVNVNCIEGLQEDILLQTKKAASEFLPKEKSSRIKGLSFGNLFSLELDHDNAEEGNWRTKMTAILEYLETLKIGLFITIDEISPRLDEMVQVASTYQMWLRENRKVSLLMAGLPSEILSMVNNRSTSFLRRASQYTLGNIDDYEIRDAFQRTVEDSGKGISDEALDEAVKASEGFPYMMQLVGYRAWENAGKEIDIKAMKDGIEMANKDFEHRVLIATLNELSDVDKVFLSAMLEDEKVSEIADIQERMGKSSGFASRYRSRLIERGVIEAKGRGKVAFALPRLREYLMDIALR